MWFLLPLQKKKKKESIKSMCSQFTDQSCSLGLISSGCYLSPKSNCNCNAIFFSFTDPVLSHPSPDMQGVVFNSVHLSSNTGSSAAVFYLCAPLRVYYVTFIYSYILHSPIFWKLSEYSLFSKKSKRHDLDGRSAKWMQHCSVHWQSWSLSTVLHLTCFSVRNLEYLLLLSLGLPVS